MITLSDDEEIEEEAETEANLIYHVTVYHVKNMFTSKESRGTFLTSPYIPWTHK